MTVRTASRALLLAILMGLVAAAPAAAERRVPFGFFAVHWSHELAAAPAEVQDAQFALMARSGVEAIRTDFNWASNQQLPGDPIDFSRFDRTVAGAAAHGIEVLPVVNEAPRWARAYPWREKSPPRDPGDFAAMLGELVERYGPNGSFWAEHPELPEWSIREWQIWNEPHLRSYWDAPERGPYGYLKAYGTLLRRSHRAIKSRDPRARVVLAGITQRAWEEIEEMYRVGRIKGAFDAAALQIFPQTVRRARIATQLFRAALNARGDRRKPIYITEISWPASRGRTPRVRWLAHETPRTMAAKLGEAYAVLARRRRTLGLERVYWFTWASQYGRGGSVFNYAGLQQYRDGKFTPQPALEAFRRRAIELQGCEKTETGDCL
ncbi:MAG TPA: hypothetical protein VEY90_03090 [Thermoleophilaceae bacterium]|nr:hypothetical protein [Thermoleophilaceae bacterium]